MNIVALVLFAIAAVVDLTGGTFILWRSRKNEPTNYVCGRRIMTIRKALPFAVGMYLIGALSLIVVVLTLMQLS